MLERESNILSKKKNFNEISKLTRLSEMMFFTASLNEQCILQNLHYCKKRSVNNIVF